MSITVRPQAVDELADILGGIRARNPPAADAVEAQVQATFQLLEANPLSGAAYRSRNPRLAGLRHATVRRYPQFVILYFPTADGIDVLHVVRGRRNLRALLAND